MRSASKLLWPEYFISWFPRGKSDLGSGRGGGGGRKKKVKQSSENDQYQFTSHFQNFFLRAFFNISKNSKTSKVNQQSNISSFYTKNLNRTITFNCVTLKNTQTAAIFFFKGTYNI